VNDEVLHLRYRPQTLDEVIGQGAITRSLKGIISRRSAHAFLFSGPSGCGKTTLARITAFDLGCLPKDVLEIDAATRTGIDDMRKIQEILQYRPFGKGEGRAVIVDECHMLSKASWNSLLKSIEEPPPDTYWFFCTTEAGKVPATVKTRCAPFVVSPVDEKQLGHLFDDVCKAEKIDLPGDVGDLIIKEARGSPRQMLVNLELCRGAKTKKEAAGILKTVLASDPVLEFCRFVIQGKGSWTKAMAVLGKLEDEPPESIRIVVSNYVGSAVRNAKGDQEACRLLFILDAFATPYNPSEGLAPLMSSIGRVLFSAE
jgi:DNA polymerase III gamma/tau subunit